MRNALKAIAVVAAIFGGFYLVGHLVTLADSFTDGWFSLVAAAILFVTLVRLMYAEFRQMEAHEDVVVTPRDAALHDVYLTHANPAGNGYGAVTWQPTTPRSDLVKYAAQLVSEIERRDTV